MSNENIRSRHQPAISAAQSSTLLLEGEFCATSGSQAKDSLYNCTRESKEGEKDCQEVGTRRCSESSPTRLHELLLEVETDPDRMPREAMRRCRESPLTLYQALDLPNGQDAEEADEEKASGALAQTSENVPSQHKSYPNSLHTIRHIIVDLWDLLRRFFERLRFEDEAKDLATTTVERCIKREEDFLWSAEKQIRAFVWKVAHNVSHEAWKRMRRWQAPLGELYAEDSIDEGLSAEHYKRIGRAYDQEDLLGEEEERADERRCWDEVRKRLPKSDLETLLSYIERESAIERGERRPALQPRERVRIFRAIGRARLLGQEVRRERAQRRSQPVDRSHHPRPPRGIPKRPLRAPRKRK